MAVVQIINMADGQIDAAYPVPPTTNIPVQAGQQVQFVDIPYGDPNAPEVIIEVIDDRDVQVTTEDGTVLIEGLYALLEEGEQVQLVFADTGQAYGSGADAVAVPIFASLDAFTASPAAGPDGGDGGGQTGTGGRGNDGSINPLDLNLEHIRAASIEGEIPRPEFDLPVDIETDFLGDEEVEEIVLVPGTNMVWEKGLNGGSGGDGEGGSDGEGVLCNPTNGSALKLTLFEVNAGDTISFDWFFDTDDYLNFNDYAFFTINGEPQLLTNILEVGSYNATGWATVNIVVPADGDVVLGFGVGNTGDSGVDSHLLVDNIKLNGTLITDGSFESGFGGMATTGDVTTVTSHDEGGGTPTDGTHMAKLTSTSPTSANEIESFLDMTTPIEEIPCDNHGGSGDAGTMPHTDLEFAFGVLDTAGGVITGISHPDGSTSTNGDYFIIEGTFPDGEGIDWILQVNRFTGEYEFELLDNTLEHPGIDLIGEDDQVFLQFNYSVQVGEQSASSTLTIAVKDDGPLISLKDGDGEYGKSMAPMIFEKHLPFDGPKPKDQLLDIKDDDFKDDDFPMGVQGINFNFGADGPAIKGMGFTIALKSVTDGDDTDGEGGGALPLQLLTSADNEPVLTFYDAETKTLFGYTDGEGGYENPDNLVFTVELTNFMDGPDGNNMVDAKFTLYQAIEHPDIDETQGADPIDLLFTITATDGDGDTASVDALFVVKDDGPGGKFGIKVSTAKVDEDGLVADGNTNGMLPDNTVATGFIAVFGDGFGADGPGADGGVSFDVQDAPAGLTSRGEPVIYSVSPDGQTLTATADGVTVFTVTLDLETNQYEVVLSDVLDHTGEFEDGFLSFDLRIVDGDGDAVTSENALTIQIKDAQPYAKKDFDSVEAGMIAFGDHPAMESDPATGNVFTGIDTVPGDDNNTDGNADIEGADGVVSISWLNDVGGQIEGDHGTLTVDGEGNYSYDLDDSDPAVIALGAGDKDYDVFTYTITDADGDESTTLLVIKIKGSNDGPEITVDPAEIRVSEEGLPGGLIDDTGSDDTTNSATDTAQVVAIDPDGDPLSYTLSVPLVDLNSDGQPIQWSGDGTDTLTGTINGGLTKIITIEIDHTGEITVDLMGPVDHPNPDIEDELSFNVDVTVTDNPGGDVTPKSDTTTVSITIEDDSPDASSDGEDGLDMLILDESPLGTDSDDGSAPVGRSTVTANFSNNFAAPVAFGGDGPGSVVYSLALNGDDVGSGLYALDPNEPNGQGDEIVLNQDGNVITGSANGIEYFTISVNPDNGEVEFHQINNIWHGDTGDHDDSEALTTNHAGDLQIVQTVTDNDGDSDSAAINLGGGNVFKIEDDGPDAKVVDGEGGIPDMLVLDETRPLGTETDGNSNPAGLDTVTAQFADNFVTPADHGTDGPGDVSYSLSLSGDDVGSGLYALEQGDTDDGGDGDGFGQGDEIVLNQTGDTITGSVDGVPYFTISINPDTGAVTFTQLENKNIWHDDKGNDDDSEALTTKHPSDLQIVQTVTDADGDSDSATINLGGGNVFKIEDDGPTGKDDTYTATELTSGPNNLLLVLDISGSMNDDSGVDNPDAAGNFTRLELAVAALKNMLDSLPTDTTTVQLITFSNSAQEPVPGMLTIAEAKAALDVVLANGASGSTNYDAPVVLAQAIYNPDPSETNLIHFLSDGKPNSGNLDNAERLAWENHVDSVDATAFAIGVGDGIPAGDPDLEAVAHPVDSIVVDEADLEATLEDTISQFFVEGNVLTGDANGGVADMFGTDGPGGITSITVDGRTFNSDGTDSGAGGTGNFSFAGSELTVETDLEGTLVFNFDTGAFNYTGPNPDGDVQEVFPYVIVDRDGDSSEALLTINVPDSVPVANDDTYTTAAQAAEPVNLLLILDTSGSMADDSGVNDPDNPGNFTRLELAVAALNDLLDQLTDATTTVQLIAFSNDASVPVPGVLTIAEARAALDVLLANGPGGSTDYDDAAALAQTTYNPDPTETNLIYFVSDGKPTGSSNDLNNAERQAWENHVDSVNATAFAIGVGSGIPAGDADLEDIAHPGDSIVVTEADLSDTLVETLNSIASVSGNVLTGDANGGVADDFGFDLPGSLVSITVDGVVFTLASPGVVGGVLNVTTVIGGDLTFNFNTGDFSYVSPDDLVSDQVETFQYVIEDSDGDTAMADLIINVPDIDEVIGTSGDDDLTGTAADEVVIGGRGDDTLHGGDGNDFLFGGDGSDEMFGDGGTDVFGWSRGDIDVEPDGAVDHVDTVKDYSGVGGDEDVLDISDLLSDLGITDAADVPTVFQSVEVGPNVELQVDVGSGFETFAIIENTVLADLNIDDGGLV